ncbi:MAG: very short patch repair endonuclease [Candidatus Daviesbacteria bacterium]|nr:very short patch repair endonuclease [Candidatus Daviesbacteria bacterium]
MADVHTKEQRSYNMSRIRSKNTKPETIIFELLRLKKIRFRKHYPIPGKPDIAFPKLKIAVFIDGEFWHGKDFNDWKEKITPFWLNKISKNIIRDKKNFRLLRQEGWTILRLWGKGVVKSPDKALLKIIGLLEKKSLP